MMTVRILPPKISFLKSFSLENYQCLTVPPAVWMGFQGIAHQNMLLNLASTPHDPEEIDHCDLKTIPYAW